MSSSNSAVTTPKPPPPTLVTTNTPPSLSVSSTGTVSPSSLNTTPGLMKEKTKPRNEEDNEDDQKKLLFSALIQYEKGNQDIIGIMIRFYPLLVKDYKEYIMNYQYADEDDFKSKFKKKRVMYGYNTGKWEDQLILTLEYMCKYEQRPNQRDDDPYNKKRGQWVNNQVKFHNYFQ